MDFRKKSNADAGLKGFNIRFTLNGYNTIKKFCQERDYKIGAYSEVAVLEKIEKEIEKSSNISPNK